VLCATLFSGRKTTAGWVTARRSRTGEPRFPGIRGLVLSVAWVEPGFSRSADRSMVGGKFPKTSTGEIIRSLAGKPHRVVSRDGSGLPRWARGGCCQRGSSWLMPRPRQGNDPLFGRASGTFERLYTRRVRGIDSAPSTSEVGYRVTGVPQLQARGVFVSSFTAVGHRSAPRTSRRLRRGPPLVLAASAAQRTV